MPRSLFPETPPAQIPVQGMTEVLCVERIFCIGRNYHDHAKEMGAEIIRDKPFFFLKGAHAAIADGGTIPYPPETGNYHYEMELALVMGEAGFRIDPAKAPETVFGYCCALDMTRRDLQVAARDMGRPWDVGKDVEQSAVFAPVVPASVCGHLHAASISLTQNGTLRQSSSLDQMIWSVPELIALVSRFYHLRPGDVIMTGTPAGVGAVAPGDRLLGRIDGLQDLNVTIGEAPANHAAA